jgi:hypothetical protein
MFTCYAPPAATSPTTNNYKYKTNHNKIINDESTLNHNSNINDESNNINENWILLLKMIIIVQHHIHEVVSRLIPCEMLCYTKKAQYCNTINISLVNMSRKTSPLKSGSGCWGVDTLFIANTSE